MALQFPKNRPDETIWVDPSNRVTYVYDRIKNSWTGVGIEAKEPSIDDAPRDNRIYARKELEWVDVMTEFDFDVLFNHDVAGRKYNPVVLNSSRSGVPEAPDDGLMYFRSDNSWVQLERNMDIRALPNLDTFARNNRATTFQNTRSLDDAPNDGRNYVRKNGDWVILEIEFDVEQYQEVS